MDRFFQILAEGVHRLRGHGQPSNRCDSITALFGAPIAHEDHAHRACFRTAPAGEALRRYAGRVAYREGDQLLGPNEIRRCRSLGSASCHTSLGARG